MKNTGLMCVLAATLSLSGAAAQAQSDGSGMVHTPGMQMDGMMTDGGPTEPGQGAFAAIGEIVALLSDDPDTDWSRVNIRGLREHLVDMDMLVSRAEVTAMPIENGLEMRVALTGPAGGAVSRMVPNHGPVMAAETGWDSAVTVGEDAVIWRVTSARGVDQIRALGFFGIMTVGGHHQAHHIALASGAPMGG